MNWIKCSDQLPPFNHRVLAYSSYEIYVAWRKKVFDFDDVWTHSECCGCNAEEIIGWCELPSLPEPPTETD